MLTVYEWVRKNVGEWRSRSHGPTYPWILAPVSVTDFLRDNGTADMVTFLERIYIILCLHGHNTRRGTTDLMRFEAYFAYFSRGFFFSKEIYIFRQFRRSPYRSGGPNHAFAVHDGAEPGNIPRTRHNHVQAVGAGYIICTSYCRYLVSSDAKKNIHNRYIYFRV